MNSTYNNFNYYERNEQCRSCSNEISKHGKSGLLNRTKMSSFLMVFGI